ncbi:fibronectin type III domain-containing protein [Acidobacteriota bacterium]
MKRSLQFILYSALLLSFFSCGKKGALEPPIIRIPKTAENVELIQRGNKVFLRWKNPVNYIDGNPISGFSEVEIWLLIKTWKEINTPELTELGEPVLPNWEKEYRKEGNLLLTIPKKKLPDYIFDAEPENPVLQFIYPLESDFMSKKYLFSIRVKDVRRRKSLYSTPVSFDAKILSHPPVNFRAEVFEDKIEIRWDPPVENIDLSTPALVEGYNVFRAEGNSKAVQLNSTLIKELSFNDKSFSLGNTYSYFVRASSNEDYPDFESEDSETLVISPKDIFPPAPPKGVVLVTGTDILSLSWNANLESDLGGYRVWKRAEGESEFGVLMADPFIENSYTDSSVEKNIRYYYAITSMDKSGNESEKSDIISEIIRDGFL